MLRQGRLMFRVLDRVRCSHALAGLGLTLVIFIVYRSRTPGAPSANQPLATMSPEEVQVDVDYIASYLNVTYEVLDNIVEKDFYRGRFVFTNHGDRDMSTAAKWSVFFYHLKHFKIDMRGDSKMAWRDVEIDGGRIRIRHVQGNLFELIPTTATFPIIPARGGSVTLNFLSQYWCVARTDMLPNWYVAAPGARPVVLACTAGETLGFMAPLRRPEQLWRRSGDLYMPWTPQHRFTLNHPTTPTALSEEADAAVVVHPPHKGETTRKLPVLVPTPLAMDPQAEEWVTLDDSWAVSDSDTFSAEVEFIAQALVMPVRKDVVDNLHCIVFKQDSSLAAEEYRMGSSAAAITILAATPAGAFYAAVSLHNLIDTSTRPLKVAALTLHDAPRLPYRGLMLDVSRNFFPPAVVRRVMDVMALYKLNKLHLHLTDDEGWRLQILGLPELTDIGGRRQHDLDEVSAILPQLGSGPYPNKLGSGFYSVNDYQELLRYANSKHIQVIPEIDMPSHGHAAIKAMEARHLRLAKEGDASASDMLLSDPLDASEYYSPQSVTDGAINPCMTSSFAFAEFVVDALIAMHKEVQPLKVFHFGGDEVPPGAFTDSPKCLEYMQTHPELLTTADLKRHFVKQVGEMVAMKGLQLQGWNDGFNGDHGFPMPRDHFKNSEVFVNFWLNMKKQKSINNTYLMANDGYKMILSYGTHLYLDHPQEPDPEERGLYWATRYIDTRRIFELVTGNIYAAEEVDMWGNEQAYDRRTVFDEEKHVMLTKKENIIGLQAQVWTETIRTEEQLFSMLLPRLLAVAERAWHLAAWENLDNLETPVNKQQRAVAWTQFAGKLGATEVKRLADRGYNVYLPPPGARWNSDSEVEVNCAFPGLPIEYSADGGINWQIAEKSTIHHDSSAPLLLRTRSPSKIQENSFSRVVTLSPHH